MGSPCAESNTIQNLAISIAISILIILLGTILNIAIWKRNQCMCNFLKKYDIEPIISIKQILSPLVRSED